MFSAEDFKEAEYDQRISFGDAPVYEGASFDRRLDLVFKLRPDIARKIRLLEQARNKVLLPGGPFFTQNLERNKRFRSAGLATGVRSFFGEWHDDLGEATSIEFIEKYCVDISPKGGRWHFEPSFNTEDIHFGLLKGYARIDPFTLWEVTSRSSIARCGLGVHPMPDKSWREGFEGLIPVMLRSWAPVSISEAESPCQLFMAKAPLKNSHEYRAWLETGRIPMLPEEQSRSPISLSLFPDLLLHDGYSVLYPEESATEREKKFERIAVPSSGYAFKGARRHRFFLSQLAQTTSIQAGEIGVIADYASALPGGYPLGYTLHVSAPYAHPGTRDGLTTEGIGLNGNFSVFPNKTFKIQFEFRKLDTPVQELYQSRYHGRQDKATLGQNSR